MSKIRFRSLSSAEFSVSVSQAGAEAELSTLPSYTLPEPEPDPEPEPKPEPEPEPKPEPRPEPEPDILPSDPSLKVEISASRTTGTAPAGFVFEAAATGFGVTTPQRDLRFKWDFGDPASAPFTALSERFDATVKGRSLDWRNSNVAYTWMSGHTFFPSRVEFDGADHLDFTVRCTVQGRDGRIAQGKTTVRINNPDIVFADATVGVDATGDYADLLAEHPNATGFKTIGAAYDALGNSGRILLKRGQTYSESQTLRYKKTIQIGAYGDAAKGKPEMYAVGHAAAVVVRGGIDECSLWGFDIRGDWDVAAERSPSGDNDACGVIWYNEGCDTKNTIHDVWFRDINSIPIYPQGKRKNTSWKPDFVFSNVRITNYRGYGVLSDGGIKNAFIGFAVLDDPLKMQGYDPEKNTNRHDHGPIRITECLEGSKHVFDSIELQSWAGWSGGAPSYEYGTVPAPQSAWRFNPGASASPGDAGWFRAGVDWTFTRFVSEGGSPSVYAALRGGAYKPSRINAVADKGIVLATAPTGSRCLLTSDFGTEVTNVLCVVPYMVFLDGKDYIYSVGGNGSSPEDLAFRGISIVNWCDPAVSRHGGTGSSAKDFEQWEPGATYGRFASLFHCPFNKTPSDLSAQVTFSEKLFPPRYWGLRFIDHYGKNGPTGGKIIDERYATRDTFEVDGTTYASVVMPVPIKGQLTAKKEEAPIDDIFGEIRPDTPHLGCVEPSSVT